MNPFRPVAEAKRTPVYAAAPTPQGEGTVSLRLYDPIDSWGGYWGISAKEFTQALDALPEGTSEIRLLINSPGGDVFEGLAILNALRNHPAKVTAVVEGIAASSASFIAAGVDELVMSQNSELFVHNAWTIAMGDAADLTKTAADLTHIDRNIASIYAAKAGKDVEHWLAVMNDDLFLSADESVDAGLADRVEGVGDAAAAKARFDLSVFERRGAEPTASAAATPQISAARPGQTERKELPVSDTLKAAIREKLGVTDADASEETLIAALDEVLAEGATATATIEAAPVVEAVAENVVVMDAAQHEQLVRDAAAGREAREQQVSDRRDRVVDTAISEGRIAPASRDQWRASLDKDEDGITKLLASFATNTIPVAEVGHADTVSGSEDALYNAAFGIDTKEA